MNYEQNAVEKIAQLIAESRQAIAFTGAGISTKSGIADFRSPGGIWSKYQPVLYRDFFGQRRRAPPILENENSLWTPIYHRRIVHSWTILWIFIYLNLSLKWTERGRIFLE
ncbi:MAG: hypothetical protein JXA73_13205 [Acidobacteria bacterium]|nr:hypothetical protein [Acidobacteriota bacterium]